MTSARDRVAAVKHHSNRFKNALQDAIQAVTNPGPYMPEDHQVIDRPNYMLVGLKAPHVYGFPDQDRGVRIAATSSGEPRRVQRNHMLHYDEREYKPMVMESMYRSL